MSEVQKAAAEKKETAKKAAPKKAAAKKAESTAVALELHNLQPPKGAVKRGKRKGQGEGTGNGRQAGRGHNGQKSRSGYSRRFGFEGGQMPLVRRLPKRGFHNLFRTEYAIVNVSTLAELGEKDVTPEMLLEKRVIRKMLNGVKVLGNGEIKNAINVKAHAITKSAREKIEAAGGKVELIEKAKADK